jgi:hypothetical protein
MSPWKIESEKKEGGESGRTKNSMSEMFRDFNYCYFDECLPHCE